MFEAFNEWLRRNTLVRLTGLHEDTILKIMVISAFLIAIPALTIAGPWTRGLYVVTVGLAYGIVVMLCSFALMLQLWKWKLARYGMDQERLREIQWADFEMLMDLYFRLEGNKVEHRGGRDADGGVDLLVTKDGKRSIVQCKHYRWEPIGVKIVRETLGVMHIEKLDGAIVVTTGAFSEQAQMLEERCPELKLIAGPDITLGLKARAEIIEKNAEEGILRKELNSLMGQLADAAKSAARVGDDWIRVPRCVKCDGRMILKVNPKDRSRYWACGEYPKCEGSHSRLDGLEKDVLWNVKG